MSLLYDVIAVNLVTSRVRLIATEKTEDNADAITQMAVMRRGVEDEFFAPVTTGSYQDGDTWKGQP